MTTGRNLAGATVLVVEDDFYLADDEKDALEAAGAQVLGPCPSIAEALTVVEAHELHAAILDVSVVDGPSFDLARMLSARGIRTLFVTGYDAGLIPSDLSEKTRLQKPIAKHTLVKAVEELLNDRSSSG
jgi:DNA-binding response OmpR family regulator